jgi:O-acetyl-ADP-ribose deacetylase (regulator of RNase III)
MTTIKYIKGDATAPQGDGPKIIAHGCNSIGAWGAGFVLAVSKRWKHPEREYRAWYKKVGRIPLGLIQLVRVEEELSVCNCIIQDSIGPFDGIPRVEYPAVRKCFTLVAAYAVILDASIHMPRVGCGLAGGTWGQIEPIIRDEFCAKEIQVTVYDL